MRRRAFVHLVAYFLASLPFAASAFAADGIRLSGPIVHDNLAIYLVHGAPAGGAVPLTLQEALAKGAVKVRETGSVNALTVENTGWGTTTFGNGTWSAADQGDSIVKLGPPSGSALPLLDYFTPYNQPALAGADLDLGAGGVVLLPTLPNGKQPLAML